MTTKPSHKLKALDPGHVTRTIAGAASHAAAARALGVNASTIFRWVRAGKVAAPVRGARRRNSASTAGAPGRNPKAWARQIQRAYDLSPSERELVRLGELALGIANDVQARPADRLAAASRFQSIVRQLQLEVFADGQTETAPADIRPFPRRA